MIISFDKRFYSLKAVKNSIKAYQGLAVFKIKKGTNKINLKVGNIDKDIKNIFKDEFCNYVLSEIKKIKSQCL